MSEIILGGKTQRNYAKRETAAKAICDLLGEHERFVRWLVVPVECGADCAEQGMRYTVVVFLEQDQRWLMRRVAERGFRTIA